MPYIGNTIRAADDYRLIDDISSGFNGSTTSFALQVAGSAPVPFPKSPQQVLISVNGVIQEPDPTGASGFNLVGTNIVFSSAPTNGHAFFGIIYATADYLNAGGNFPSGSLGAPSITFIGDENTGLYRKGSGSVGFVSDATEIANFDSNGITISSGDLIIPAAIIHNGDTNTKIRFPANDTVTVETSGSERLRVDGGGHVSIGTNTSRTVGGAVERKLQVEGADGSAGISIIRNQNSASPPALSFGKQRSGSSGGNTIVQDDDKLGTIQFCGADGSDVNTAAASIQCEVDGTPGANDMPGRLIFSTTADGASSATERMRIDSSGVVRIGGTASYNSSDKLTLVGTGNTSLTIDATSSTESSVFFADGASGTEAYRGYLQYKHSNDALAIGTSASEAMRIDSSGNVGIGGTAPNYQLHATTNIAVGAHGFAQQLLLGNNSIQSQLLGTGYTNLSLNGLGGKVGIGTTSPNALLEVKADDGDAADLYVGQFVNLEATAGQSYGVNIQAGSNSTDHGFRVKNRANDATHFLVRGDGNVGIGTTSPAQKLHVQSTGDTIIRVTSADGNAAFLDLGDVSDPDGGRIHYDSGSNLVFNTASTERLRIDASGRVAIGTSTTNTSDRFTIVDPGNAFMSIRSDAQADGNNQILDFAVGTANRASGNLTASIAAVIPSGATAGGTLKGLLKFSTNSGDNIAERMRIDSEGRVAISSTGTYFDTNTMLEVVGKTGAGPNLVLHRNDTTVSNNQVLAALRVTGNDNDGSTQQEAAAIEFAADGDHANNDKPARIVFKTTADGGSSSTERMRIDSSGNTHFGSSGTLNDSNTVSIIPSDGRISFGMDGRTSYVTGENSCYIYSGEGSSGTTLAGDLILQSRSNGDRTIRFITGSSPAQRVSITNNGLLFGTDTAAANALDDYEEGTWTATAQYGNTTNYSLANVVCRYTKVGSLVHVSGRFTLNTHTGATGELRIGGLPFAKGNPSGDGNSDGICIYVEGAKTEVTNSISGLVLDADTRFLVRRSGTTASGNDMATKTDTGTTLLVGGTYTLIS